MTDTVVSVNKDALKTNASQYGWTSVEVARVDLLSDYLNQAFALLKEVKDFQGEYDNFFDIFDQVTGMYNELTVKISDFNVRFPEVVRLHGEVVRLHGEVVNSASIVATNASQVAQDTTKVIILSEEVQSNHDKVVSDAAEVARLYADMINVVEELKKGNVYRGTWNPHTANYPTNHGGTNSTWDVVLNAGENEYTWNGAKWYWGDRLVYLVTDGTYTQIETGSNVISVNNKTGAVVLDLPDLGYTAENGSGQLVRVDGPKIVDLESKIDNIVGGAIISDTPPLNPKEGVTWYCTEDARTYIWYKDEDGTVQWVDQNPDRIIIENIGGVPLLSSIWFPSRESISPGYVPADGQLVSKALYPDAWDKVDKGTIPTVPDANWIEDPLNRGAYTTGNATHFRLPDYNGRSPGSAGAPFVRGDGTGINAGRITESQNKAHSHTRGDMNITGSVTTQNPMVEWGGDLSNEGALSMYSTRALSATTYDQPTSLSGYNKISIDASKSWTGSTSSEGGTEARPLNVTGVWALKMYDQIIDPAALEVSEVATELAIVKAELASYVGAGVPTGTVQWMAADHIPFGYLLCDGREVSRTAYPDLFRVIGEVYGAGNRMDTFNLPNLLRDFIRGYHPTDNPVGERQGDAIRNLTGSAAAASNWGLTSEGAPMSGVFGVGTNTSTPNMTGGGAAVGIGRQLVFDAAKVVPTADENRPRNVAMVPVIKAYSQITNSGALNVADLTNRVLDIETVLKTPREICLVHAEGTGAPNEVISPNLPENITVNTRYVLDNPFGKDTPVSVEAQIFHNNKWSTTETIYVSSGSASYSVSGVCVQGEGIVVQTGRTYLTGSSADVGSGHGATTTTTSAPCRIFVRKTL